MTEFVIKDLQSVKRKSKYKTITNKLKSKNKFYLTFL